MRLYTRNWLRILVKRELSSKAGGIVWVKSITGKVPKTVTGKSTLRRVKFIL